MPILEYRDILGPVVLAKSQLAKHAKYAESIAAIYGKRRGSKHALITLELEFECCDCCSFKYWNFYDLCILLSFLYLKIFI